LPIPNNISVLILTCNEQLDLPACLDSIPWCDDIHLLDSGSTDRTAEIAAARGAHVTFRPFDTFAAQRNASLQLHFKHPWVLVLDADERPTPELSAEMQQAVASAPANIAAFRIQRRDFLWGTWLKHAQMTPYYVRLLRLGHARYERDVNEVVRIQGDIGQLQSPLDHMAFSKGLAYWVTKHNAYSTTEAALLASGDAVRDASVWQALFARNFHERRVAQKAIFYSLPLRPFIKWGYMMFIRGAVLDGKSGMMYATLHAFYEYLIEVKCREIRRNRAGLPS
jgi:glycosyltransferase involved in cell wall biosynthesis